MSTYNQRITLPFKSDFDSALINRLLYGTLPRGLYGDFTVAPVASGSQFNSVVITPGETADGGVGEPMMAVFPKDSTGTAIHIEYPEVITVEGVIHERPWLVLRYTHASLKTQESEFRMVAWSDDVTPANNYDPLTDLIIGRFYFDGPGDILTTHYDSTHQTRYSLKTGKRLDTWMRVRTAVEGDTGVGVGESGNHLFFDGGRLTVDGNEYVVAPKKLPIVVDSGAIDEELAVYLDLDLVKTNSASSVYCAPASAEVSWPQVLLLARYTVVATHSSPPTGEAAKCRFWRLECPRQMETLVFSHSTLGSLDVGDAGHTQFAMLLGRSGGQTISGGTLTSQRLGLQGNAADLLTGGVDVHTQVQAALSVAALDLTCTVDAFGDDAVTSLGLSGLSAAVGENELGGATLTFTDDDSTVQVLTILGNTSGQANVTVVFASTYINLMAAKPGTLIRALSMGAGALAVAGGITVARSIFAQGGNIRGTGADTTCLGVGAVASIANAVALGTGASARAQASLAAGLNASCLGSSGVALGSGANASGAQGVALGAGAVASGSNSIALGHNSTASTSDGALAVGINTLASGATACAFGYGAQALANTSLALGFGANVGSGMTSGVALGVSTIVSAIGGAALGQDTQVLAGHDWSTAIGSGARTSGSLQIMLGAQNIELTVRRASDNAALSGVTDTIYVESHDAGVWFQIVIVKGIIVGITGMS